MIITKIKRIRGRHPRYSIVMDDAPSLELSDWTITKLGLRTGDELDELAIERIRMIEAETQAKNVAINYLSYRPRSRREVVDHLVKKGFERPCSINITDQLASLGMINDLQFAYAFVRDRIKKKPTGAALLRKLLAGKGISSADTDRVIGELTSDESQQKAALAAARRKLTALHGGRKSSDDEKRKKRMLDFLLRRGFSYEIAMKTVRTTLDH